MDFHPDLKLPQLLTELLEGLMQDRDDVRLDFDFDGRPIKRWEDDEFIYLEADLPGERCPDIDISIHEGRAFIRIERPPVEPANAL